MQLSPTTPSIRFGLFDVNLKTGELRKSGVRIRLQEQPFAVLAMLLEHPGEIVTREELRQRLWTNEFVEFEQGLSRAINKLRTALGDVAKNPRFIETLPKRGYRFIVPVQGMGGRDARNDRREAQSLAILPLVNVADAAQIDYLCEGITETLIYSAAQLADLRVMARSTVFRYKGVQTDPQLTGQELHVGAVFTGRVRQSGDLLILNVELIDVEDGSLLWGEQYRRRFSDIFSVQEEIAIEIFSKLRVKLTRHEQERVKRRQTSDPEAYAHYLQGRYYWNKRTLEGFKAAIHHFEQAIENDPDYALGHAGIADYYTILSIFPYSFLPPAEAMPRAKSAALRALEIDPGLAEAHASLGMINFAYEWNYAEAEKHFHLAIDLKPGYVTAHQWYSLFLAAMSHFEEAGVEARKSLEIDPCSAISSSLGTVWRYFGRDYDRTLEELRKSALIEAKSFIPHLFLGYVFCAVGEYERAIESFEGACKMSGENLTALARLGFAYGRGGRTSEAKAILTRFREESKRRYIPAHHFAFLHLGLDDNDSFFAAMEKSWQERSDYLPYLNVEPPFDTVRDDPRFHDLLRRLNFRAQVLNAAAG
jgi:TolB-like protein/tetratricopeptide (TPR) repeat protein